MPDMLDDLAPWRRGRRGPSGARGADPGAVALAVAPPASAEPAELLDGALASAGNRALKRALDLLGSVLGLTLFAPLILLCGLTVKLIDPGPAFFRHRREGLGGAPFEMWKIRTMRQHHPDELSRLLAGDPAARDEWGRRYKLTRDPRVVPGVGRFLRRYGLDELPQLWNVLRGEMSLVGPRPLPLYQVERFDAAFRRQRNLIRPGITGLWQVTARTSGDLERHLELDTSYLRRWSLKLDLRILAKTVGTVMRGEESD